MMNCIDDYQVSGFLARPEFPKWLGRNSTTIKNRWNLIPQLSLLEIFSLFFLRRLLNEVQLYLSPLTTTSPIAMRTSGYVDLIYERV